jgi:RNA polymerase sigma-70 factor (ECF subfamily)
VPRDEWISALNGPPAVREPALAELHALLLRAARFELGRRRSMLSDVSPTEIDDLAEQAADDAMVALLGKLDTFRGASRFTTWAYKFALLEAGVKARRRAWRDREVPLEEVVTDRGPTAQQVLEDAETLRAVRDAMHTQLTDHQRRVFVALALNGVPIDVLAERMDTTRGALYKTLHDARNKLRAHLSDVGLPLPIWTEERS